MKRIQLLLCAFVAMFMLSVNSAWAGSAYVKVTAENGTVSWIEIKGTIKGTNFEIGNSTYSSAIDKNTKGSIDLNEVWSLNGGKGIHYQVTSIGYWADAFYYCSGLTSIIIPNSVTHIGTYAFEGCSGLTSIVIPNSVTYIGGGAFSFCSGLTSIVVESGNSYYDSRNNSNAIIETASNDLRRGCKNTMIPSSVTRIGSEAFCGCSGLTSVDIPSSVTCIGVSAFHNCSSLTSIVIPSSVTSIETGAFTGCSSLISINLPSSITSIQYQSFYNCSGLTSIVIPSSVTSIGEGAFSGCSGLTSITSYITEVFETGRFAFSGCNNAVLYVPDGLVSTYRSTKDWNCINKIEEIPGIALAMSCNNKGKVQVNGSIEFTNDLGQVNVKDGVENTFAFQPNDNCELRQVLIDGLDVTVSVENNQLTTKVHEGSKMIVMFDKTSSDVNGDGQVDISDVVRLVNIILGQ
ncbi:MAG: leucine-rich repeat protein [Bacteroidaceae bacterium]|nr:leucine-rich repeat protein [Bacteroidaceae bacterium]